MPSLAEQQFHDHVEKVRECVSWLKANLPVTPPTIIQLGTGLGGLADQVDQELLIPYSDIPHFPESTVSSHSGNLILGRLGDEPVIILQGRFHFYEGYNTREVSFPIRVLALLGAKLLLLTNAAGGLNPLIAPKSIMVIRDHLNFLGENPLRGPHIEEWGPRFPDLSHTYHPALIKTALDSAATVGLAQVISGVYGCVPGPSLETPAETRWLRDSGADAVGMSSVPEVIVARHGGMEVLGLSVIANVNDPDNQQTILLDDIVANAEEVGLQLEKLLVEIIQRLAREFFNR